MVSGISNPTIQRPNTPIHAVNKKRISTHRSMCANSYLPFAVAPLATRQLLENHRFLLVNFIPYLYPDKIDTFISIPV